MDKTKNPQFRSYCNQTCLLNILIATVFIALILPSCSVKKEKINISIILAKDIRSENQEKAKDLVRNFANYYKSTGSGDTVYIPEVSISREDLSKKEIVEIPYASTDKLRKSIGLLSTKQIISTYDKEIGSLSLPAIFSSKGTSSGPAEKDTYKKYQKAFLIDFNKFERFDSLKNKLYDSLVKHQSGNNLTFQILLIDTVVENRFIKPVAKVDSTPAISLTKKLPVTIKPILPPTKKEEIDPTDVYGPDKVQRIPKKLIPKSKN